MCVGVCVYTDRRAAADAPAAKEELAVVRHDAGVPHALDLPPCNAHKPSIINSSNLITQYPWHSYNN